MRDVTKFHGFPRRFRTMYRQLDEHSKKPYFGYTMGGSSLRPHPGARVAATDVNIYRPKRGKPDGQTP